MFIILKNLIDKLIIKNNLNNLIKNCFDIDIVKYSKNNKDYFIILLISKLFKFVSLKPVYDLKKKKCNLKKDINKKSENKESENKESENKESENKENDNKENDNKENQRKKNDNKENNNKKNDNSNIKNKSEINLKNKYLLKLYKKCVIKCHPDKCNNKFNNDLFLLLQYSIENNELYLIILIAKYLNINFIINKELELVLNYYINWLDMHVNYLNSIINS